MATIFLNYRRSDSGLATTLIRDRLVARFGEDSVFHDVIGIGPGERLKTLRDQVAACRVMVVVIGPRWTDILAERAREAGPDHVKIEIEAAFAGDLTVIPVLVDGAPMPRERQLPESLADLADIVAQPIGAGGLEAEIAALIKAIERGLGAAATSAPLAREAQRAASPAGTVFRDPTASGGEGPEMVVIPAGDFVMGSPKDEPERRDNEGPQHRVSIARPFAMGRYAVTFDEYDAFCAATGRETPDDRGWGRGRRPAINVSWEDAQAYCAWLSEQTGADYRLPSEAEWEYACRAGTETPFWWGRQITPEQANYAGNFVYEGGGAKGDYREKTEPVDAFEPNPWGLYQTHGNVLEWCQDAWNDSYQGAPSDSSAWMSGDASIAVLRGGSWGNGDPRHLRSASRYGNLRVIRGGIVGFRLARTLPGE